MRLSLILPIVAATLFIISDVSAQPIDTSKSKDISGAVKLVEVDSVTKLYSGPESSWLIQREDRWCWAASAEIIMSSYGQTSWKQCIQADDAYPGKSWPRTCCDYPESTFCNRTGWPHFEFYGFNFLNTDNSLKWEEVTLEIDNQRPVAVAVHFNGGGGHMAVVAGYAVLKDGTQLVSLIDPDGFHGAVWSFYDDVFGDSSGIWYHWRDYYDIRPLK